MASGAPLIEDCTMPLTGQVKESGIGLHVACVETHWVGSGILAHSWDCHTDSGLAAAVKVVAVVEVSAIVGLKTGSAQVLVMR